MFMMLEGDTRQFFGNWALAFFPISQFFSPECIVESAVMMRSMIGAFRKNIAVGKDRDENESQ